MRRLVIDTSVVSYLLKGHTFAASYREYLRDKYLCLSFMTVAELYRWPFERSWGEQKIRALIEHLRPYTVLPYDDAMSWEWARIMSRKGSPISPTDAWIAATAVCNDALLVTHNPRHFQNIAGLNVVTFPTS